MALPPFRGKEGVRIANRRLTPPPRPEESRSRQYVAFSTHPSGQPSRHFRRDVLARPSSHLTRLSIRTPPSHRHRGAATSWSTARPSGWSSSFVRTTSAVIIRVFVLVWLTFSQVCV